jgi:hypothetical protein
MIGDIMNIVAQQIVSKAIVDDAKIPYKYYEKIQPLTRSIQNITDIGSEVDPKNPFTWYKTANKMLSHFVAPDVNPPKKDRVHAFLDHKDEEGEWAPVSRYPGFTLANSLIKVLVASDKYKKKIIKTSDKFQLMSLEFEENKFLYILGHANDTEISSDDDDELSEEKQEELRFYALYLDTDYIDESFYFIMSHVWRNNECIQLSNGVEGGISFNKFKSAEKNYIGDSDVYIESIKKFMNAKIKRTIMFQGIPGSGKTTLCSTLHRALSVKTIYIDMACLKTMSNNDWFFCMKYAAPTVVIIEDVDRNFNSLDLVMIEEPHYNVPLTLFTANAQSSIPVAYRRPGRVDQIIKMGSPDESQIWMNIEEFAEMEGVDLTDIPIGPKELLMGFRKSHSEAHIVELLKRYKVEGWEYIIPPNDMSFQEGMSRDQMETITRNHGQEYI